MLVHQIMRHHVSTVPPHLPMEKLVAMYGNPAHQSRLTYVVDEGGILLGVIGMPDLLNAVLNDAFLAACGQDAPAEQGLELLRQSLEAARHLPAESLMRTEFARIDPHEPMLKAARMVLDRSLTALPVVNSEGILVGEVTRRLLLQFFDRALQDPAALSGKTAPSQGCATEFFIG